MKINIVLFALFMITTPNMYNSYRMEQQNPDSTVKSGEKFKFNPLACEFEPKIVKRAKNSKLNPKAEPFENNTTRKFISNQSNS
jgi:hypothetical protein